MPSSWSCVANSGTKTSRSTSRPRREIAAQRCLRGRAWPPRTRRWGPRRTAAPPRARPDTPRPGPRAVDESDRERLVGVATCRPVKIRSRASREPDQPRQPLGPAGAGDDAEQDLGQPELRVLGAAIPEVAGERDLAPSAEREAVDRRDRRLRDRLEVAAGRSSAPTSGAISSGPKLDHGLDVGAGGEDPLASPDDDRPHAVVARRPLRPPPTARARPAGRARSRAGGRCGSWRRPRRVSTGRTPPSRPILADHRA